MAQHILWKNPDGSLKVTHMFSGATREETLAHKDVLIDRGETATFQGIVGTNQLPNNRYFRNAWRWNGTALDFDLPACRERHLNKLRRVRTDKLQDSDPDFIRALEQNNTTQLNALKAYRQALRDMPQSIAAELTSATTPDAIRAIRPAILDVDKP